MSEQNKARSRRFFEEGLGNHNLDAIVEIWAEDGVSLPANVGVEQITQMTSSFWQAFPDLVVSVEEQVAEGDIVVTRLTVRGTHEGLLMGQHEATGKPVSFTMIAMHKHVDGQIVEGHGLMDFPGLMRQING